MLGLRLYKTGYPLRKYFFAVLLLVLFLSCSGCSLIPAADQFIAGNSTMEMSRSSGNCEQESFAEPGPTAGAMTEGLSPDNISILNWNIYKGLRSGWQEDLLKFGESRDIILLQEAALSGQLRELLQQSKLFWNFNSAFRYKGMESGVLVASMIPPLESCGMRQNEPVTGLPKTILVSKYAIAGSGDSLLVANIHSINITLGIEAYTEQLNALQEVLQKHAGPIILAGDFNNWTMQRTAVIDSLVEKLALTLLTFEKEERTTFFGDPVDHILYRGVEPVSYRVVPVTSSDHNPITVTFRLDEKPEGTDGGAM